MVYGLPNHRCCPVVTRMVVTGARLLCDSNKPQKRTLKRSLKPGVRFPKLSAINLFSPPDRGKISLMELPSA